MVNQLRRPIHLSRLMFHGTNGVPKTPDSTLFVLRLTGYGEICYSIISLLRSLLSFSSSYVQGARVILPPESHEERGVMEVWDFNVISGQHEESQSTRYNASAKAAATLFTEPLRTSLPSQAHVRTVKEEYGAFMIDEERVIAVKVRTVSQPDLILLPTRFCSRSTLRTRRKLWGCMCTAFN